MVLDLFDFILLLFPISQIAVRETKKEIRNKKKNEI